jgi:hypothetical protein
LIFFSNIPQNHLQKKISRDAGIGNDIFQPDG